MDEKIIKKALELKAKKEELRECITRAEEDLHEIERELRELSIAAKIAPKLVMKEVVVENVRDNRMSFFRKIPFDAETIRFKLGPENMEDRETSMNVFGAVSGDWNEQISLQYFRINNVLLSAHGGFCYLKDYQICTDEEWEDLKRGIVAEKFLNK